MKTDRTIAEGPFEPTWESLRTYVCPDWFRDAKFGIWSHWGPQSVPMFGDWYARMMYMEGTDRYLHHWRVYGHPSVHGYKDIVKLWKAERFDPEELMDLYVAAGARYFCAQAVHHDNFDNWNSTHHRWNAVQVGPKKDIVGLWAQAARRRDLPFGVTEHLGATFTWWMPNKGADKAGPYAGVPYDGTDPEFEDLYLPNRDAAETPKHMWDVHPWLTDNAWWHEQWFARVKDVIDQHQPDLLYSDCPDVPFGEVGLSAIAHLYNLSTARHGENRAVYTQKNTDPDVFRVGVLDVERGVRKEAEERPWQTDTCLGGWFYDVRQVYKTARHVVEMLVDIAAKNGSLLLNVPQLPDGTLDDECRFIVEGIGQWMDVNAEGMYDTRPWRVAVEGPTGQEGGAFKEDQIEWTPQDFRFTAKGDAVYAFQMAHSGDGRARIAALASGVAGKVTGVDLLGAAAHLSFSQDADGLQIVGLPERPVGEGPQCFRVRLGE